MILRPYQQTAIDQLYYYWTSHPASLPIVCMPTGSGKSIVIAELVRLFFDTWPEHHPRTVVLVPSKELAEQNAEKLRALLPSHLSVGYYSASLGKKQQDADVIVATIGSIYKDAHLLGNIKMVIIDEAHLVSPDGIEAGRYRQFLSRLARINQYCTVGFTATVFRGNGVWLTDGEAPLFTGVAHTVKVQDLLDDGYLSTLIRPMDAVSTRIDVDGIKTTVSMPTSQSAGLSTLFVETASRDDFVASQLIDLTSLRTSQTGTDYPAAPGWPPDDTAH